MKISVITVVYNSAHTVADALQSVAKQDYPNVEHIVVDGNSTDGTADVVRANSDRVSHFVSEPDRGIYDAMNKGLTLATGDVIGFLNADDVYATHSVLSEIAKLHGSSKLDACYADLVYVKDINDTQIRRYWRSRPHQEGLCFRGWMPAHPTLYLKRSVFDRVGNFDISLGNQADLEFCARAFELHSISSHYSQEVWVRMRTGGASQSSLRSMVKSNWASYKALKKLGLKRNPIAYFAIKLGSKLPQFLT